MSDYLTRMAERAAGWAPAVRPLVAPLFAPPPESGAPAWEKGAGTGEVTLLLTPPAGVAAPGRRDPSERPAPPREAAAIDAREAAHRAAPALPAELSRRQAETGRAPAGELPAVAAAPPAAGDGRGAKAAAAGSVALRERGSARDIPTTDGARMAEPSLAGRDTFERAAAIVRRTGEGEGDELLLGEVQILPAREARSGEAATPTEMVPTSSPGEMRPQGPAAPDRLAGRGAAERGASVVDLHGAGETAPPTIRISIGRIEVRAAAPQPPATARPASPPAAKVSLDDYLRKQSGGAR